MIINRGVYGCRYMTKVKILKIKQPPVMHNIQEVANQIFIDVIFYAIPQLSLWVDKTYILRYKR